MIICYSGSGFLGHEKEVNIVFKEIAYGKGSVLRCSGRRISIRGHNKGTGYLLQ
jgi:hypothetical protein